MRAPEATYYHYKHRSTNSKTGRIPVTVTSRHTCWDGCPLFDEGCYADEGFFTRKHWRAVSAGRRGGSLDELCASVSRLPFGQLWRHNAAGDLPGINGEIARQDLDAIVAANRSAGARGFTYTHKDLAIPANREAIRFANDNGFAVNLSANDVAHADELAELNIGPVVVILPLAYQRRHKGDKWLETLAEYRARLEALPKHTPAGRRVPVCPATYLDDRTCANCGLCAVIERTSIVGFPAHGAGKEAANLIAMAGAAHAAL